MYYLCLQNKPTSTNCGQNPGISTIRRKDNQSSQIIISSQNTSATRASLKTSIEKSSVIITESGTGHISLYPTISLQVELTMSKLFWICHFFLIWKFSQGRIQTFITTIWDTWVELPLSSSTEAAVHPEILEISTMFVPDSIYAHILSRQSQEEAYQC